jgi:RNA polymerase sigma-70 factor (ECF subfamily)
VTGNAISSITEGSTSSTLLVQAAARDPQAWERLVRLYGPILYHWARRWGLQEPDAADIVQEVFRALLSGLDSFRRDQPQQSFRAYLATITRNKLRDRHRRHQRSAQAAGGSDAHAMLQQHADPSNDLDPQAAWNQLQSGLWRRALDLVRGEFETTTWEAFWRVTVEERPVADVAQELGLSKPAVRQAKYRVLKRLRTELEGLTE